jgi:hypothetical protein
MKKHFFIAMILGGIMAIAMPPKSDIQQYDPASTVFVDNSEKTLNIVVDGKDVVVSGNKNVINFTGVCKKLVVKGSGNDINIDTVAAIEISGDNNFVAWRYGPDATSKPTIIDKGGYNNVGKRSANALNKDEN